MFTVLWWVLALGAVALLTWVCWRLVRAGAALVRAFGEAATLFDRFSVLLDEATARHDAARSTIGPQLGDDLSELRAQVGSLRVDRMIRRAGRRSSHGETYRTWDQFNR